MTKVSNIVNRNNLNGGQKEFVRKDLWLFKFTRSPLGGIPFPGNDIIHKRLKLVDPGVPEFDPKIATVTIRGVSIKQAGGPEETEGTLTMTYIDFSDQIISKFLDGWKLAAGDRESRQSLPKKQYTADGIATLYDVNGNIARQIKYENIMPPTGADKFNEFSEVFEISSEQEFAHEFEHAQFLIGG